MTGPELVASLAGRTILAAELIIPAETAWWGPGETVSLVLDDGRTILLSGEGQGYVHDVRVDLVDDTGAAVAP